MVLLTLRGSKQCGESSAAPLYIHRAAGARSTAGCTQLLFWSSVQCTVYSVHPTVSSPASGYFLCHPWLGHLANCPWMSSQHSTTLHLLLYSSAFYTVRHLICYCTALLVTVQHCSWKLRVKMLPFQHNLNKWYKLYPCTLIILH